MGALSVGGLGRGRARSGKSHRIDHGVCGSIFSPVEKMKQDLKQALNLPVEDVNAPKSLREAAGLLWKSSNSNAAAGRQQDHNEPLPVTGGVKCKGLPIPKKTED